MTFKIKSPKYIFGYRFHFTLQAKIQRIGFLKPEVETVNLIDVFKLLFFKKVKTTLLTFIDKQEVVYIELGFLRYIKLRNKRESYVPYTKLFTIFKQNW